jgi:PPOX class probable FMN-dependent enzyme
VVFRDFRPDTNCLLFVTDRRSHKVVELTHHAAAEVCWYFANSREQFRIGGAIALIDANQTTPEAVQLRHQVWAKLSDNARQQFAWPHPGQPRVETGFEPSDLAPQTPLETFVVLELTPDWVDHLELRGEPQNRHQYWLVKGTWQQQAVNP